MAELSGWYLAGRLKPHVDAVYPLEAGGAAIRAMMDRQARGKLIVKVSEG